MSAKPNQIAFVLAGGGSLGAIQVGMLQELLAAGVVPDLIVGVSAGAINGAFLAHDPSPTMLRRMVELWSRLRTRDVLGLSWRSLLAVLGLSSHLAHTHGLRRLLERELPYRTFDQARIPLYVVAADQQTGDEVLLSEGAIIDAVLASTAIPGVFPAVELAGRRLVDGAVAANTPIATAVRLGATRLFVLPCGFTCVEKAVPTHPLGRAMHAITLLSARQLRQDFTRYRTSVNLCLVPPLCPLAQSSYDYSNGAKLIAAARASTRQWIDDDGLDNNNFPHQLETHSHG